MCSNVLRSPVLLMYCNNVNVDFYIDMIYNINNKDERMCSKLCRHQNMLIL